MRLEVFMKNEISRRDVIATIGAAAGVALFVPRSARAQQAAQAPARTAPPTVISSPPRDFTPGATPVSYPDPDILTVDAAFNSLRLGNTPVQRLWTGGVRGGGAARSRPGGYLGGGDISKKPPMRFLGEDGGGTPVPESSDKNNSQAVGYQGRPASNGR